MSDFFSAVSNVHNVSHHQTDDTKSFADAIQARFGQPDQVLTARLLPPALRMPSTPMAALSIQPTLSTRSLPSSTSAHPPSTPAHPPSTPAHPPIPPVLQPIPTPHYTAVPPAALSHWLDDPATLVVDIRPHAAYSSAHLSRAISLSVPSTLLKRPLFSLQRLSAMLPSRSARARFSAWRSAARILVYDADSPALSDTSNIQGLLRKFRAEAPDAPIALAWVQGGFQAVWAARRDLVDTAAAPETETEDDEPDPADPDPDRTDPAVPAPERVLRAHHLPRAAFALTSTTQAAARTGAAHAFNPFFDTVRQNTELAHGITERIPLRLPRRVRRRIAELPFQWLRDIARRAAPATPPLAPGMGAGAGTQHLAAPGGSYALRPGPGARPDSSEDESSDSSVSSGSALGAPSPALRVEEGTEALAMQFYRIELAEQRRLMGVMEHHSRESGADGDAAPPLRDLSGHRADVGVGRGEAGGGSSNSSSTAKMSGSAKGVGSRRGGASEGGGGGGRRAAFPFSITAGVEKGSKNRYRNIWPFEHARVRLHERVRVRGAMEGRGGGGRGVLVGGTGASLLEDVEDDQVEVDEEVGEEGREHDHDDYVNASYVQPLGTTRRYIATQGPLEATFGDFWTLVWQQNARVIVMLTREVEGAQVKCGAYWRPGTYGPLRVELLGCAAPGCVGRCALCSDGAAPSAGVDSGGGGGFFLGGGAPATNTTAAAGAAGAEGGPMLIRRTLRLTHAWHPRAGARTVVQLQYLGWPDMNVPEDARGVLGLVWEVARVVAEVGRGDGMEEGEGEGSEGKVGSIHTNSIHTNGSNAPAAADRDTDMENMENSGSGAESDGSEVDGATGVLWRELRAGAGAAPVVLHCSAGVGRTGGFIAVDAVLDAVRREARETYGGSADAGANMGTGTGSGGSSRAGSGEGEAVRGLRAGLRASGISPAVEDRDAPDRMDVDGDGEAADAADAEGRGMRTPMQVDGAEVGLGLGARATRRWAERVADTRAGASPAFTFTGLVPNALPQRAPASAPPASNPPPTRFSSSYPATAVSSPAPFQFHAPAPAAPPFALTLPGTQRSLPETGSPALHAPHHPETKSASLPIKTAAVPLAVRRGYADPRIRTFSTPGVAASAPTVSAPWLLPSASPLPNLLGRSLVDSPMVNSPLPDRPRSLSPFGAMGAAHRGIPSLESARAGTAAAAAKAKADEPANAGVGAHVDYMEPRPLHGRGGAGPVRLSALEDPIWEVLQDMREQRMSLCQSLRQYVFVHAAIIEGALLVVDEERARAGAAWRVPRAYPHPRPALLIVPSDGTTSTTSSTGKRLASPTELPKEDTKGEIVLSKRPSLKQRKQAGTDDYSPPLHKYAPPLMTFPPP
ncbi:hypothetical protein B0H15DRAFT_985670 [Mycena belliarum]|uniref:protein-tyrosine-phosphatase n=1 Tax=Mycena belliarum TaxID=1033014 RepID=A0AAD6UL30_9AGAR|nr:hypothetical protein B0H15DRAFT_985670 [Mycena belliae]